MSRRTGWIVGAALAALVLAGVVIVGLTVSGSPSAEPSPDPAPSESVEHDIRADAQTALEKHLDECAGAGAPDGVVPDGCGIRIPWGSEFASVTDVRFRIERMPELALTADDGFTADGGVLVATVTGTGQDGAARTETYRTDTWGVRGEVEVTDDDVDVIVW